MPASRHENHLGQFLRARRELTRPEEHGLPDLGRRRVPGLRREEVAMLAGVSAEYYIRLERGRDRNPSKQVIDSLARVLDLDRESTEYLTRLAAGSVASEQLQPPVVEQAGPRVLRMMAAMNGLPAFVLGPYLDVLAYNSLAEMVHGGPPGSGVGAGNMLRHLFLDPAARQLYPQWSEVAAETVAALRASVGTALNDARLVQLVGELSVASGEFAHLWARHEVRAKTAGDKHMMSPTAGELHLTWETMTIPSAPGQQLITYFAEPGSVTAQRLSRLVASVPAAPGEG